MVKLHSSQYGREDALRAEMTHEFTGWLDGRQLGLLMTSAACGNGATTRKAHSKVLGDLLYLENHLHVVD